jgi:beta-N-acetylhexosaminidase
LAAPLILAPEGPVLSPREAALFRALRPWGFILFSRNLDRPLQIRRLTEQLRDCVGRDAPVLIDQEGGRVQRMRAPLALEWRPPLEDVQRLGKMAARGMALRYRIIALELLALGIDVNCAPTLDIARDETHPFLRNRCLGTTRAQVSAMGQAVAGGLMEGGVLPVIKHMPGHGRGQVDSHLALPRTDAPLETLQREDFMPFAALAEMPLGMTAHMVFDAIDPDAPVTTSAAGIRTIREDIGFEGLLMTDDISMEALRGGVVARAQAALAAGCDVVLHCNGDFDEMAALAEALPAMARPAARRASASEAARVTPPPGSIETLWAKYQNLL